MRSYDCGLTWEDIGMFDNYAVLVVAYIGEGVWLVGTGEKGKILRSINNGLTWTDLGTQFGKTDIRAMVRFYPSGTVVAGTYPHAFILRSEPN